MPDPATITVTIDREAWALLLEAWGDSLSNWSHEEIFAVEDGVVIPVESALKAFASSADPIV